MLTHHSIARFSLALLCLLQGGTTVLIDLGRTHASNPAWTAHARFHVVWQTMTVALLAVIELILIFAPWPLERQRFFLASMLALLPMIGFFAAFIGRSRYGGTLGDQNGMAPMVLKVGGRERRVDLNLAMEIVGICALATIVCLYG